MSEQIDYEERLPRQPSEGALDWCIKTKFKSEYAIYRDTYYRDPLTGIRENAVSVACTACGGSWIAEKVRGADCGRGWAPLGFVEGVMQIGPEDKFRCPQCGAELRAKHIGQLSRAGIDDNVYFCEPWQLGSKFVLLGWRAERNIGKDARKVYRMWPYEAYVFEQKKAVRLTGYQKFMNTIRYFDSWRQVKRCDDRWGKTLEENWFRKPEDLSGTTVENAALPQYMKAAGDKARPVAYLRLWQKHRNIENLIVQGCGGMVARAIADETERHYYTPAHSAKLEWIDWKQKRPARMLGLDRQEFALCIREKWTQDDLAKYKMVRAFEPIRLPEDWNLLKKIQIYNLNKLCSEKALLPDAAGGKSLQLLRGRLTVMRCLRYLERQKSDATTLLDYWNMARRAGLDLRDEHVQLPKSLKREHDRLVEAERIARNEEEKRRKQAEIEKRRPAFEKTVAPLEAWAWEDAGICIRPAHTEEELIEEGAVLDHCVGTYGETVARGGSCIFFIRRADAPDIPWYTLQVELKTLQAIQNHGIHNFEPTEEVQEFVERWLEHVRQLKSAGKKNKKEETAA